MKTLTITIEESDEGYMYSIYDLPPTEIEPDTFALDGGLCTGSMEAAVGMAAQDARDIIARMHG